MIGAGDGGGRGRGDGSARATAVIARRGWPVAVALLMKATSAGAQSAPPPPDTAPAAPTERVAAPDEIIVVGRRAEAAVPAETEYNEAAILARGADSIGTLLDRLRSFIDESGEPPVLLVNGKPIGLDRSLLSFPPEALAKIAVLQPEAAAQYGEPAERRVVNLVLKRRFASIDAEAGLFGDVRGGRTGGLLSARRTAVAGDTRWNATARLERQGALLRSAREVPPLVSAPPGVDPNDLTTLLPSRRAFTANIGLSRPVGSFTGSLAFDAAETISEGLRGPGATGSADPLLSATATRSLGVTTSLTGLVAGFQTNMSANYATSRGRSRIDLSGPGIAGASLRNRSRSDVLTARVIANRRLFALPAGPVTSSIMLNLQDSRSRNRRTDGADDASVIDVLARQQVDAGVALTLPITGAAGRRGAANGGGWLGRLSAQLNANVRAVPGTGSRRELGGGLVWAPVRAIELRGSVSRAGIVPSPEQLTGPLVTSVARVFDFARLEVVEVARLTGGNADLVGGSRRQLTLAARVLPFGDQRLTLGTTYRRTTATDAILGFPELTPAIEAAFPGRVTRDPQGRLVAIDARPIAAAADRNADLVSTAALRLNQASPPAGAAPAPPRWTFDLSLSHRWRLTDRLLIAAGGPVIDQLRGDGGQSRHTLSAQASAARPGFGINTTASWSSRTTVRGTGGGGAFDVAPPLLLTLDLFVRPFELGAGGGEARSLWKGTTASLLVQNLLGDFRRVTAPGGAVPAGSTRDEIDPAGPSVRFVLRKLF